MRPNGRVDYDVAVLGGGPAGAATALALARAGRSVALVEKSSYAETRIGETLPPRIRSLLFRLGVWEQFLAAEHRPAPGILSAWGRSDLHRNDFILNPYGDGWHVDRRRFDSMLSQCAADAGVAVYVDTPAERIALRARFVVDATGRTSSFARRQGVRRLTHDRLIGVIRFCKARSESAATLIESAEEGWWYAAALPDGRAVAAYITDADLYGKARNTAGDVWQHALRRTMHIQSLIDPASVDARVRVVSASVSRLETMAGTNWMAVGDAAFTLDPLSGQGVYNALRSALRAAEAIEQGDPRGYCQQMERDFDDHCRTREHFYQQEKRWADGVFWRRRQPLAAS